MGQGLPWAGLVSVQVMDVKDLVLVQHDLHITGLAFLASRSSSESICLCLFIYLSVLMLLLFCIKTEVLLRVCNSYARPHPSGFHFGTATFWSVCTVLNMYPHTHTRTRTHTHERTLYFFQIINTC